MGSRRFAELLVYCAAALLAMPAAAQSAPRPIYCCDSADGQPVCGDILPDACYRRAYRVVSPQGTILRRVAAPLTAAEIAERDAEQRRRRFEEAERARQQRLDQALLDTYRSLSDLDVRRDREVGDLDRLIRELRERESGLIERQKGLVQELAAASDPALKRQLEESIHDLDGEIVSQRSVIDAKLRDRAAILDRFEQDRRRYLQLTAPAAR